MGEKRHIPLALRYDRRTFLRLSATGLALPLGAMAPAAWRTDRPLADEMPICRAAAEANANAVAPGAAPRDIRISFSPNAVCTVGIVAAEQRGFFARRNLRIERINYSAASDQLLELIASGKADAGVSMALGWLKPLEQGFDVNLTAGIHGGCIRLLTTPGSGITKVAGLKGKSVGTFAMAGPDRTFIAVLAAKRGLDPLRDIDWRVYPPDLLGAALQKGEIQAFSSIDPLATILRDRSHLIEVTNNLSDEFATRSCCVLGIRGSLVRNEPAVATALTAALLEAQEWVAEHPAEAGAMFAEFTKVATAEQLALMLQSHTHHHHPVGNSLKQEVALYAQELKQAGVFKPTTDPIRFADRVCVDLATA